MFESVIYLSYFQGGDLVHLLNNEVPDIVTQEEAERMEAEREKALMPRNWDNHEFEVGLPTHLIA